MIDGKKVLVTGGTGSLGQRLVSRMLSGEIGDPDQIVVFSRDEAKQHYMRLSHSNSRSEGDDLIYRSRQALKFIVGDVRDYDAISNAINNIDIVVHSAALKQVPTCEYFPVEAVKTNINGAANLVRAIRDKENNVELVIGVSTDKACQPLTVMGMTKSLQERILIEGNLSADKTRFVCVRYGNVIGSRGSVVPLFLDQIRKEMPITVTEKDMTRFIVSLDQAVDTVFTAISSTLKGEILIPRIPSIKITDLAYVLSESINPNVPVEIEYTGIRPNEKLHELLISAEEGRRTIERCGYLVIQPDLPELSKGSGIPKLIESDYSSEDHTLRRDQLKTLLGEFGLFSPGLSAVHSGGELGFETTYGNGDSS